MTGTSSLPSPRSSAQANNSTWAPSTCACEASTARLRIRPPLSSSTAATVITCLLTGLPALSLPHYTAVPKWCSQPSLQMVNPCSKPSTDSDRKTKTYLHSGTIWGHYLTSLRSLTVGTADIWGLLVRRTTYPPVSHHLTYSKCISTYKIRGEKNRLSDTARKQAVSTLSWTLHKS